MAYGRRGRGMGAGGIGRRRRSLNTPGGGMQQGGSRFAPRGPRSFRQDSYVPASTPGGGGGFQERGSAMAPRGPQRFGQSGGNMPTAQQGNRPGSQDPRYVTPQTGGNPFGGNQSQDPRFVQPYGGNPTGGRMGRRGMKRPSRRGGSRVMRQPTMGGTLGGRRRY